MKKYENFISNLHVLERAPLEDLDNEFILSGVIDKFFIQFELGWKLFKELLQYEGRSDFASGSPRDVIKTAYNVFDLDEKLWLEMLAARNDASHIYNEKAAKDLVQKILGRYIPEFQRVLSGLEERYGDLLLK